MIVFENSGEIDLTAVTTFGVSVKEGANPIGFFGTGLKYAIAVLLRTNCKISVWSGEDEYIFGIERVEVRNRPFDFVTMRTGDAVSTRLGFTTELGKTWEPWMAYRELYCNTRDEGGEVYACHAASSASDPRPGLTQIRVEGDAIEAVHAAAAQYFLEGEPDAVCGNVQIFRRPSPVLFYRGIRVLKLPRPSLFTYNLLDRVELTEDRTMSHPFMAAYYLARAMTECEHPEVLEEALTADSGSFEAQFDYHSYGFKLNPTFLDAVGRLTGEHGKVIESARLAWDAVQPRLPAPDARAKAIKEAATEIEEILHGLERDHGVEIASAVADIQRFAAEALEAAETELVA
jgi:hypothetical protein